MEKPFFVDVRSRQEFDSGTVVGAINIPLDQVEENIDAFRDHGDIVVFCRSGARAEVAKGILNAEGINNVVNGGSWQEVARQLDK